MFKELFWYSISNGNKKKDIVDFIFCFLSLSVEKIPKIIPKINKLPQFIPLVKLTNNGTMSISLLN